MFTYYHANTPLGQSVRAYYVSYLIKLYGWDLGKGDHDDRDWLILYLFVSVFIYLFIYFWLGKRSLNSGDRLIIALLGEYGFDCLNHCLINYTVGLLSVKKAVHIETVLWISTFLRLTIALMSKIELCYEIYKINHFSQLLQLCAFCYVNSNAWSSKWCCGFYNFNGNCKNDKFHVFSRFCHNCSPLSWKQKHIF